MLPRRLLQIALLLTALWGIGDAFYIQAKALAAQALLELAWQRIERGEARARPWSWADTWPVARLSFPRLGINQIVLAGTSGRVLAFGPGQLHGTGPAFGISVISGHRDTHFRWLQELRNGDHLVLALPGAETRRYRVSELSVHHEAETGLLLPSGKPQLVLLTCYPFRAVFPGGPLRYVVTADEITI